MPEEPIVSYNIQRERLVECDVEELIEAMDINKSEQLIDIVEDAGRDDLIYKAFRYVEGEGNIKGEDE